MDVWIGHCQVRLPYLQNRRGHQARTGFPAQALPALLQSQPAYREKAGGAIPARLRAGHQRSAQRICGHRGKTDAGNIPDGHHQHQRIQQHLQGLHQHDTIREW